MTPAPRRTVRFDDAQWEAGQAKAAANNETLAEVLRWLLDAYLTDNHHDLAGYTYQYRATPKDQSLSDTDRENLTVGAITGPFDEVRRHYPARTWLLEERIVAPYRPATRKSG
ncbi:hypothetical protein [Mycolicibacterium llatzerense]|uniref:hypothetical protein n=1 Tax=Mycolicibacterium llatzerense TaxID=280871 RepID=UPI0021B54D48|nr:hypothetical protein [Mycolicibacterium llatzerense]MCT7372672.1 hypothetical protein [Mycolicibacterium llatzerense]